MPLYIGVSREMEAVIVDLAARERRPKAQMGLLLIEEALRARGEK